MFRRLNVIHKVLKSQSIVYKSTVASVVKPIPLITCKNTKFNFFQNDHPAETLSESADEMELASKGWQHYKAKGDHFIIHAIKDVIDSNFKDSVNFADFEFNEQLLKNLSEKHGIEKATKLQKNVMDEMLMKKHVLIAAETGCGKVCLSISGWLS